MLELLLIWDTIDGLVKKAVICKDLKDVWEEKLLPMSLM